MRWHWDLWELFILIGYTLFFARHVVLWWVNERERRPTVPLLFWHLSLVGGGMLVVYSAVKGLTGQLLPAILAQLLYLRNTQLAWEHQRREAARRHAGFTRRQYPWPTVSVIIPAHNEASELERTLDSLDEQHYAGPAVQVIVVASGCTDDTVAQAQGRTQVIEQADAGPGHARNAGAAQASGDILVFWDADTSLVAGGLQEVVEALLTQPEAGWVSPRLRPDRGGLGVRLAVWQASRWFAMQGLPSPSGVLAVRRSAWERVGPFREDLPCAIYTEWGIRARAGSWGSAGLGTGAAVSQAVAVTSIRRYKQRSAFAVLADARADAEALAAGRLAEVQARSYPPIRESAGSAEVP